jgi:hypothetical protein
MSVERERVRGEFPIAAYKAWQKPGASFQGLRRFLSNFEITRMTSKLVDKSRTLEMTRLVLV